MELSNSPPVVRSPTEADGSETPTRVVPTPAGNGVLKRHAPLIHHNIPHPVVFCYKECLKNFAANLGGHSLDGCGEFLESATDRLLCSVCGCHRNFHRRDIDDYYNGFPPTPAATAAGDTSPSPPPISSAYAPPHMLMGLNPNPVLPGGSRKRHRTKFTEEQKAKMPMFADEIGWKMQKKDDGRIEQFCEMIGVDRNVFKVWMHNNKNSAGKKKLDTSAAAIIDTPPLIGVFDSAGAGTSNGGGNAGVNLANGEGEMVKHDVEMVEAGNDGAGGSGGNGSSSSTG